MISLIKKRIKDIKQYTHDIQLKKHLWIWVAIDYTISHFLYKFTAEDYFIIGNGYTLSRYAKKRFFTMKRVIYLQDTVNNSEYIHFLENKADALNLFKDFVSRNWLYTPNSSFDDFIAFVKNTPVFIAKPVEGVCGKGIEKYSLIDTNIGDLQIIYNQFVMGGALLEECLRAHDDIYLGTKALSTFRIYTMIDHKGEVHVLKAKYRAGTGDAIIDTAEGCIAYPISIKYGVVEGPGINEVLNSKQYFYHPGCDKLVVGMKIPMWDRVIEVVTKAAKMIPQLRYIGWDIAITNNSVEILEGNHNAWHGTFEIMGNERLWWPKIKSLI